MQNSHCLTGSQYFIHGMKISLQHRIPGVSIQGASQADELWQKLESYPEALVMLDGDQDGEFCYWLLQKCGAILRLRC